MRKPFQGLVLAVLASFGSGQQALSMDKTNASAAKAPHSSLHWTRIPGHDGVKLAAVVYTPDSTAYAGKRPLVVLPASWAVSEWEYNAIAEQMANDGYVAVAYAPRGFSVSGGLVDVAGPKSQKDVSSVIDWMVANTQADGDKVGIAGISYGAGLGMIVAGLDPRVKAVVALSGWADLRYSLYAQDTLRNFWLDLLVAAGAVAGRLDPEMLYYVNNLKTNSHVEETIVWGAERSAVSMVDQINQRQVPIFIGNSYEDNLFPPAQARSFFSQLTGPKKFYLDHGIHGTSAIPGLIGLPNDVWIEGRRWLDQWLLGVDTGILKEEPVTFQTDKGKVFFHDFPPLGEAQFSFALQPLNALETSHDGATAPHPVVSFMAGVDSGATTGIPILSDVGSSIFHLPVRSMIGSIDQRFAAVYQTAKFDKPLKLRGSTRVHVPVEPHDGPMQVVVYMYEMTDWGLTTLISHGVATRHTGAASVTQIDLDLGVTAYDLSAGTHVVIAIDSIDPLYQPPFVFPYKLALSHSDTAKVTLDLPLAI